MPADQPQTATPLTDPRKRAMIDVMREAVFSAVDAATGESTGARVIDTDAFFESLKTDGYQIARKP